MLELSPMAQLYWKRFLAHPGNHKTAIVSAAVKPQHRLNDCPAAESSVSGVKMDQDSNDEETHSEIDV
jgi:hypothetical protein